MMHCGLLCSPQQRYFLANATIPLSPNKKASKKDDSPLFEDDGDPRNNLEYEEDKEKQGEVLVIRKSKPQPKFKYAICSSHCKELYEICGDSTIGFARGN